MRWILLLMMVSGLLAVEPTTRPALPFVQVDREQNEVRVECEVIDVQMPLEFLCVARGGPDHEAVLRTPAKPSDIHLGLLLLGLRPGSPVKYDAERKEWIAPHGPALDLWVEYPLGDKTLRVAATELMMEIKDKKAPPPMSFVFAGSRILDNGMYAADATGYVVSLVNFDLVPIDVPRIVSSANETLELIKSERCPPPGTRVRLILKPHPLPATLPQANSHGN